MGLHYLTESINRSYAFHFPKSYVFQSEKLNAPIRPNALSSQYRLDGLLDFP